MTNNNEAFKTENFENYDNILLKISSLFINNKDFTETIKSVLNIIGKITNVSRAYIFEDFDNGKRCKNTYEWVNKDIKPQKQHLQDIEYKKFPTLQSIKKNGILISNDINDLPRESSQFLKKQQIKSFIIIPFHMKDKFYGFIGFDECKKQRNWSENEIKCLKIVSHLISASYERQIESSKRKNYQKLLIESEKKYRDLVENAKDIIYIHDLKGNMIECNKAGQELIGYNKKELQMINISQILTAESLKIATNKIKEKLKGAKYSEPYELNVFTKNQEIIPVEITSVPHIKNNKLIGVLGIARDIRERKRLEIQKDALQNDLKRYAWELEKKVESLVERKVKLTEKERLMLYYFAKYPTISDNQLSILSNIKRSTITAIRNRLILEKIFDYIYIPNLNLIGKQEITICCGYFKEPIEPIELNKIVSSHYSSIDDFGFLATDTSFLGLSFSPDTHKKLINEFNKKDLLMQGSQHYDFKLNAEQSFRFFDFSSLIKTIFCLPITNKKQEVTTSKITLSKNEKKVLYALVKYHNLSILELAEKVKLSKPTVSSIKKKLLKKGAIVANIMPNFHKLGCELFVVNYRSFYKKIGGDLLSLNYNLPNTMFQVSGPKDVISFDFYNSYEDYQSAELLKSSAFKENDYSKKDNWEFLCHKLIMRKINFADYLYKLFKFKTEI